MSIVDATLCREASHAPACPGTREKSHMGTRRMEPCACPCHPKWLRREWLISAVQHRKTAADYRQHLATTPESNHHHLLNQIAIHRDAARRALHCARNVATIYNHPA